MDNIKVEQKITVTIKDVTLELSGDEARELMTKLKIELETPSYVPYYPSYPQHPNWPTITYFGTTTDINLLDNTVLCGKDTCFNNLAVKQEGYPPGIRNENGIVEHDWRTNLTSGSETSKNGLSTTDVN